MNGELLLKARELVKNSVSVCVSLNGEDGVPYVKAMYTQKPEGLSTFYFSSNLSSHTAGLAAKDGRAVLYFHDDHDICGLSLTGRMEILTDGEHKQMLWHEGDERYYPLGVTDPDYIVYRFTAERGTMWYRGKHELSAAELM